ncbi:MAG: FliM/FliN family flagellar motor switch protein [Spirochaeta sp.]|nr:FliM/FliN family flagellar motor switch protein [Spirochaeta sp.]
MAIEAVANLNDARVRVDARLGSAEMTVGTLRELGVGNLLELDRMTHDAIDLRVGDVVIARGEVVVIDETLAVRITEVPS